MPKFKFHLEWTEDEEFFNRDRAKENLKEIWQEIAQLAEGSANLEVFDVTQLPRKAGGNDADRSESLMLETPDHMSAAPETGWERDEPHVPIPPDVRGMDDFQAAQHYGLIPPAEGPGHPWDQGLNIFPEDHPYRPIERLIQAEHGGPGDLEEERTEYWKNKLLELNP